MASNPEKAYEYCRMLTRKHAKTFFFSAKFLSNEKRDAIYALYALCRLIDDEIDEAAAADSEAAAQAIDKWKEKIGILYHGRQPGNENSGIDGQSLVLAAWSEMLKTYKIPQKFPLELIEGVLMDTHIKRYQDFDSLYLYCYRVASVVGLMSCEIFGYEGGEATLKRAEYLGIAMQLTNILRDISEDGDKGRIYLPLDELRRFGISENQVLEKKFDANFEGLIAFQIARAREYYKKAEQGIPMLNKDARFAVLSASRIYSKILDEIESLNYNIFEGRAHTSKLQKLLALPGLWIEARKLGRSR